MKSVIIVMLLAATALAGCGDAPASATSCDEDPTAAGCGPEINPDDVDSDKGVIRGVVIDEAIVPIAGALVAILNSELSTETDANGGFVFVNVEPGTYFLTVSKPGYVEVQQSVDVIAGEAEPAAQKVLLARAPGTEPYYQGYSWSGFLGCSMRSPEGGRTCPGASTVWPEHSFIADYELDRVPDWTVSEMIWESTQYLGDEMSYNLRRDDTNRDTIDIEGPSPLSLVMNRTLAEGDGIGIDSPLRVIVFTAHLEETEPPVIGGWGVGVQLDQPFDTYTHVFYNYVPPQDWRFLEDTTVPRPPN